jgi:hypothetical protein
VAGEHVSDVPWVLDTMPKIRTLFQSER